MLPAGAPDPARERVAVRAAPAAHECRALLACKQCERVCILQLLNQIALLQHESANTLVLVSISGDSTLLNQAHAKALYGNINKEALANLLRQVVYDEKGFTEYDFSLYIAEAFHHLFRYGKILLKRKVMRCIALTAHAT